MTTIGLARNWYIGLCIVVAAWSAYGQPQDARIQRGDIIYVEVYRASELNQTVQVDDDGNIDLPYIGAVNVSGLDEAGAAARLSGSLKKILRNPRVTVRKTFSPLSSPSTNTMSHGERPDMSLQLVPLKNANAESLYGSLRNMSSTGGNVSFDSNTNTILITDTPEGIRNIVAVVKQLDSMHSQLTQVRIEAKVAEVRAGAFKEMGVRWFAQGDEFGMGFSPPGRQTVGINELRGNISPLSNEIVSTGGNQGQASTNREFLDANSDRRLQLPVNIPTIGQTFFGFAKNGIDVGLMLDMLVSDQKAELLANPMIVTLNHKQALIKMVDQIPYTEFGTEITGAASFSTQFLDAGIILDVTPHVHEDEKGPYVKLELKPEVSFPIGSNNGVPILSKRETETIAHVRSGQTMVIGGILNEDTHDVETKLPGIGNLPIIGRLFKHKEKTKERRELMIFVTPTIYENPEDITWDTMIDMDLDGSTDTVAKVETKTKKKIRKRGGDK